MSDSDDVERRACPACGEMIAASAKMCRFCRVSFDQAGAPVAPRVAKAAPKPEGDATGGLIPYKNTSALIAYYCGVFSIIPCIAIGIAGLVLGIKGLKFAKAHPETRGQIHAWIGIVAGGFFVVVWLIAYIIAVVGIVGQSHR